MPGTFVHHSGGGSHRQEAELLYNLYLEITEGTQLIGRAWTPIIIMQRTRIPPQINLYGTAQIQMQHCYAEKGPVKMTCTFDKNVVSNHQAINLSVDIDLTECSGGGVKEIRITVLRKLRIRR